HLRGNLRQWWGDSRGRWDGTLVVDVTNFSPKSDFQGAHENLHLVERWTRLDADTIEYVVTIDDPTTWTRPWTVKQEFKKQRDAVAFQNRWRKKKYKDESLDCRLLSQKYCKNDLTECLECLKYF